MYLVLTYKKFAFLALEPTADVIALVGTALLQ